jgi:predicted transposase YdaD
MEFMAQNQQERALYEDRVKAMRDARSYKRADFDEGRQEGKLEGEREGVIKTLLQLIEDGLQLKFASTADATMSKIRTLTDAARLREIQRLIYVAMSIDEIEARIG